MLGYATLFSFPCLEEIDKLLCKVDCGRRCLECVTGKMHCASEMRSRKRSKEVAGS